MPWISNLLTIIYDKVVSLLLSPAGLIFVFLYIIIHIHELCKKVRSFIMPSLVQPVVSVSYPDRIEL
jgi:hypothetical protein